MTFSFPGVTIKEAVARIVAKQGLKVTYAPDAEKAAQQKVFAVISVPSTEDALKRILRPKGLDYEMAGDAIRIVRQKAAKPE